MVTQHLPWQPLPKLDNPFSEAIFPNAHHKPPLVQLEAISSCPIACFLEEKTDPHFAITFQAVIESGKVSLDFHFSQYAWWQSCQPGGPRWHEGMGWQEPYEVQQEVQSPAPEKGESLALLQADVWWVWRKGPGGLGRQQAKHDSAAPWQQRKSSASSAI